MAIEIISCWYNEEFLAPYFLRHYSYADRITILLDTATTDGALDMLARRASVVPITFDGGIDERHKAGMLSVLYALSPCDYIINVDADEFVFATPEEIESGYDIALVKLYNVYRHTTDGDLTTSLPIREQRRHGYYRWPYRKPIIIKAGLDMCWYIGNHNIKLDGERENNMSIKPESNHRYNPQVFDGAHWANADPCFCVERRLERMERQSEYNIKRRINKHNHNITAELILAECKEHENDQMVL